MRWVAASPCWLGSPSRRNVTAMTVYALNLFDVADRDEYLAYSKRSAAEVARHGGRVVALGKFRGLRVAAVRPVGRSASGA
jgi:hypothetical protein